MNGQIQILGRQIQKIVERKEIIKWEKWMGKKAKMN